MKKIIIAIDPGKAGGIICGYSNGVVERVKKMPVTPKDVLEELRTCKDIAIRDNGSICCYMELVHGGMSKSKKESGSAMFHFGEGYGWLEMALLALGIPRVDVTPQKWQKTFQVGTMSSCRDKTEWKNKLKAKAQQLFPEENVTLWSSDALLIYKYACGIEK